MKQNETKQKRSRDTGRAKTRLIDMLNAHECYKGTSAELTEKWLNLRKEFNIPFYAWQYLSGYMDCKVQQWYFQKLRYCAVFPDGIKPVKWENLNETERQQLTKKEVATAHFWENKDGTFSRPWGEVKKD